MAAPKLSEKAEALILQFEGFDVPWIWPGGDSGVSIGIGFDLGYESLKPWENLLDEDSLFILQTVRGLKGEAARRASRLRQLRNVIVPQRTAVKVFSEHTVPQEIDKTVRAFPLSEPLPRDAFGALVSIVYNRGPSMLGPRRVEMRAIRDIILEKSPGPMATVLSRIAGQVRAMANLWPNRRDSDGDLYDRRMAEANLIQHAAFSLARKRARC